MSWSVQAVILGCEMVLGYVLGRVFIPYFRRIKTGKFDFYIGDRFAKDGSEPKFGGVVIMLCVIFGIVTGVIFYDSQAVLSFENGEFSRRVFIALGEALFGRVGCAGAWWSYDYGGAAFGRIFRFPAGRCGCGR